MIQIVKVESNQQKENILLLRKKVYVDKDERISDIHSFNESFDKFDEYATFFLVYKEDKLVGCFKIVDDSDLGLPCEEVIDLTVIKTNNKVLEVGHLIVLKEHHSLSLIRDMFTYILGYALNEKKVNYLVGDIFDQGNHNRFYNHLGFVNLHGPYKDDRFLNSPSSIIIGVDLIKMAADKNNKEYNKKMLNHLFSYE